MKNEWFYGAVLTLVSLGCASHPASSSGRRDAATIESCTTDAECQGNTFCDEGECSAISGTYGKECVVPEADGATGKPRPADFMCGAYICSDGRCRSCHSNEQCADVLGSPTCKAMTESPGQQCGDYAHGENSTPAGPPPGASTPPKD